MRGLLAGDMMFHWVPLRVCTCKFSAQRARLTVTSQPGRCSRGAPNANAHVLHSHFTFLSCARVCLWSWNHFYFNARKHSLYRWAGARPARAEPPGDAAAPRDRIFERGIIKIVSVALTWYRPSVAPVAGRAQPFYGRALHVKVCTFEVFGVCENTRRLAELPSAPKVRGISKGRKNELRAEKIRSNE